MSNTRPGNTLRRIAKAAMCQLDLYGQLAGVEWQEEKARLTGMLVSLLLGISFLFCLLFALTGMAMLLSWDTPQRNWVLAGIAGFYGLGVAFFCYRFRTLAKRADQAFSDTRKELAEDIALLRNEMDQ